MTTMIDEIKRKNSKGKARGERDKVKSQEEIERESGSELMTQKHCAHCKM